MRSHLIVTGANFGTVHVTLIIREKSFESLIKGQNSGILDIQNSHLNGCLISN